MIVDMQWLDSLISLLATGLTTLLIFVGSIFPISQTKVFVPTPVAPVAESVATTTSTTTAPTATSTKPTIKTPSKPPVVATPVIPTPTPVVTPPPLPTKTEAQINDEARAALVNILCLPQVGINGISGSGVVVDSRGVILTNAHIGQFFLLRDYMIKDNVTCTIRIGSPAQERYTATLLYLPPTWVAANDSQLKESVATGTGEHDYAFLLITGRTDPAATLPSSFERMEMNRGYVDIGDPMLLAAYPAGFLGSQTVQKNLYLSSAIAYVTQLFSFTGDKQVDLFSIGGTVVSQGGSSGGAVARLTDGKLMGIIATATSGVSTGDRDLRAISLAHIDDSLAAQGEGGIVLLLSGNLTAKAAVFASTTAVTERAALFKVLGK